MGNSVLFDKTSGVSVHKLNTVVLNTDIPRCGITEPNIIVVTLSIVFDEEIETNIKPSI